MNKIAISLIAAAVAMTTFGEAEYGLETTVTYERPASIVTNIHGRTFVDFGKDAFGWLEILPPEGTAGGIFQVAVSEAKHPDNTTDRWAAGTIRSNFNAPTALGPGGKWQRVAFSADPRNTAYKNRTPPVKLRPEVGVVQPFRYAEFFQLPFELDAKSIRRAMVHYPIDMKESSFHCSDARLEKVYDLCKYSILATSFAGLYVDGDRERIPYEGDAYINQLGHYAISSDTRLARASHEYLLRHPTWPTEWKQHSIMMAWADWMWTGSTESLAKTYDELKTRKLLLARKRADGLVTSPNEALSGPDSACDLIDWPPRDRAGYVFTGVSAVVNAFHYLNLRQMSEMAAALGKTADAAEFCEQAKRVQAAYNRVFRDPADGLYRDGEGTDHKGFHAQVAALAFGLVPPDSRGKVADAIIRHGMAGSVYYAQYLLEALYAGGRDEAALKLMVSDSDRSWLGMLRQGATITMEAWNIYDKPNLDWNHAWGTPPLNIISRYLLGVTPLAPGFAKISINPRPSGLSGMKGVVPTIKGPVKVEVAGALLTIVTPAPAVVTWQGKSKEVPAGTHVFGAIEVPPTGEFATNGCRVVWTKDSLTVANRLFKRSYRAAGGVLRTEAFQLGDGQTWKGAANAKNAAEPMTVIAGAARPSPVGVEGLAVKVTLKGETTELALYPEMPGVIVTRPGVTKVSPVHDLTRPWHNVPDLKAAMAASDRLTFDHRHIKATEMTALDQTDMRDRLLATDERLLMNYDAAYSLSATALDLRDVLTGEGLVLVRLAPMPTSRPTPVDDFIVSGSGHTVALLANGYPLVELAYAGGEAGRRRALIAFQRSLRPYRPGRDGVLLSNTWGAGNRDSRICQDFLLKEIEAGSRMGVDVIQIDDGWQRGRTLNSEKRVLSGKKKVWNGFWKEDPDFWKEDLERFPDGLEFLTRRARAKGMRFGLWFGPDTSEESANWERDADCLLDYHRRLGIDYFKMDSMKLYTPLSLERNRKLFDKMLEESGGAMVFDLDCTAEVRPGYFGLLDIGPLFVENRYTRRPIYWPHHTLKNLWDLAQLVDPVRLRFEFNNPDTNHENYQWSPLSHGKYRPDALFATVMAASPLAWMELSDVSEKSMAAIAPLVKTWKAERSRWHGGVIHPVAQRPDGVAWTGFVSEAADGNGGYALLFRELNTSAGYSLDLTPIFGNRSLVSPIVIGGRGTAKIEAGQLKVTVPEQLDFIWVKFAASPGKTSAAWITGNYVPPAEDNYRAFFEDAPAPVLSKRFQLGAAPGKATWTIAAAGMVDAYVNGVRVTPTALPGWTDYDYRVLAYDYEVARLLRPGENTLELRLGNGWFNLLPMMMWGQYNLRKNLPQGAPCVQATLKVESAGGASESVVTDGSWQTAEGPVLRNSLYLGERYDARRQPANWSAARVVKGPKGKVESAGEMPKVVVYRSWPAKKVTEVKPGVYVLDFGENFAGNLRMRIRGLGAGKTVTLRYGELVNADGTVNVMTSVAGQQKNAAIDPPGIACQSDTLIGSGAAEFVYEPRFTFHTFRYAEISGLKAMPKVEDFEALAYSAAVATTGNFTCSNDELNRVEAMCLRTFRANLQGVQSDCPARERFGYAGDLSVSAESLILKYDMHAFYRKVLRDRCDAADRNGGVFTTTSPAVFPTKRDFRKVWMGFAVDVPIVVDLLVRYYGDTEVVGATYPAMKRFLEGCAKTFRPEDTPPCIGDHEAIDKGDMQSAAMCQYHQFLKLAAKFARRLGESEDAQRYEATAAALEKVFSDRARYVPAKGYVGNGRQGEEVFAVYHRMLPAEDLEAAYQLLRYDVVAHDNALSTGIFGTKYLLEVLTERGDARLAGKVAMHKGFPGWINMLDHGATTLWESWIGSDNIYSHCHPMFGSVSAWLTRGIVGIKVCEDAVGCDKVQIEPHAIDGVESASGYLDTPKGRISVSWKLVNGKIEVKSELPSGVINLSAEAK